MKERFVLTERIFAVELEIVAHVELFELGEGVVLGAGVLDAEDLLGIGSAVEGVVVEQYELFVGGDMQVELPNVHLVSARGRFLDAELEGVERVFGRDQTTGAVSGDQFLTVFTVVIAFYFGTQTQKISDAVAQSEEGKE